MSQLKITGATLLSIYEARTLLRPSERKYQCWWWLRSPGYGQGSAAGVSSDGSVHYLGYDVSNADFCVRPALRISNLKSSNLRVGDELTFGGKCFRIISETYAFCQEDIGNCAFRKDREADDANDYDASDVKKYVDVWFVRCLK